MPLHMQPPTRYMGAALWITCATHAKQQVMLPSLPTEQNAKPVEPACSASSVPTDAHVRECVDAIACYILSC